MQIRLAFRRMFLDPGKTFAVPLVAGARVRVVDGMVWATTSGSPDDVWLGAGKEHTIRRPGLTVIESLTRSTVELMPPAATRIRGRITNRYEMALPKAACNIAAIAMTAITLGLLVVLPATLESDSPSRAQAASTAITTTASEIVASQPRVPLRAQQNIAQAPSSATSLTRVQ
jgi:Protein of unknown function (DUF2917)